MDISEIMLRHLDTSGTYSPVTFAGDWPVEEQAAVTALITRHDGAQVPARYNDWRCARYPEGRYSARRATWDFPLTAATFDDLLARLRGYYGDA